MTNTLLPTDAPFGYFLRFAAFILIAIAPTGRLVTKLLKIKLSSRLENASFILLTGTLLLTLFYFLLCVLDLRQLNVYLIGFLFFLWLSMDFRMLPQIHLKPTDFFSQLLQHKFFWIVLTCVSLLDFLPNVGGIRWLSDGSLLLTKTFYSDHIWKLSVMSELEHSVPPQIPVFAGHRLAYHYFTELFGVLVTQLTKIDILASRFFAVPFYLRILSSLILYIFLQKLFNNRRHAAFGCLLLMLAPKVYKGALVPHGPFAIAIFLASILLLASHSIKRTPGNLILSILFISQLMMYESILSLCFIMSLLIGGGIVYQTKKSAAPLLIVCAGATLAFVLMLFTIGRIGAGQGYFRINFPFFVQAIRNLPPNLKEPFRVVLDAWQSGSSLVNAELLSKLITLPFISLYAFLKTFVEQFQLAMFGLIPLGAALRNIRNQRAEHAFFLPAIVIALTTPFFISFSFFWSASFRLLFLGRTLLYAFTASWLIDLWGKGPVRRIVAAVIIGCFVVAPTLYSLRNRAQSFRYYTIRPSHEMAVFNFLRAQTLPKSVLMHPFIDDPVFDPQKGDKPAWIFKDHYYYGSAFGGRRVVLEGSIEGPALQMVPITLEELKSIRRDIDTIYSTKDAHEALRLLKKYHVDYLWVPTSKPLQFGNLESLALEFQNDHHSIYKVTTGTLL